MGLQRALSHQADQWACLVLQCQVRIAEEEVRVRIESHERRQLLEDPHRLRQTAHRAPL
jgi:hypothetical protein